MPKQNVKNTFFAILFCIVIALIILLFILEKKIVTFLLWTLGIILIIFLLFKLKIIIQLKEYERAVVFRFGKLKRVLNPGWRFIIPGIEKAEIVSLRTQVIDTQPQIALTKDNIELKIDSVVYVSVKEDKQSVINSVIKVEELKEAITLFVIAELRNVIGELNSSEVIQNIKKINDNLKSRLDEVSKDWGIKVQSVEITEIKLPEDIITAMHEQKAAVERKLAIYELAEGEKAKIQAVKEATENLSEKAVIYYYIKALEKMAEGQSSKIIFPLELTNILNKISSNISSIHNPAKEITEIEKGLSEKQLEQYLPLIQEFINQSKKQDNKTIKKNKK
ncbi:MAG TPA: SPFH domain-containing protein [archaeon]|jgi:regulator of protease activity HflC (stomatin/prohibitin superfamily)|nr:SPFH domain-containing protein [archaeon]